jgi:site-specific recombinase XerD
MHVPYSFPHPWPETSAMGLTRCKKNLTGMTPIIPNVIVQKIMRHSHEWIDREELLFKSSEIRDVQDLENACMLIILMVTGIRIHELIRLETNCVYVKETESGDREFWIRGISSKTGEGKKEWLAPEIASKAIKITEKIAKPLQDVLKEELAKSSDEVRNAWLVKNCNRIFLSKKTNNIVQTPSTADINKRLKNHVKESGVKWDFSSHQCRRTFAVYVARHALGDLRYLREHYKHWSIDMTALYAANEAQDRELYDDIYKAMINAKHAKISHWLNPETPVAGGTGDKIKIFRSKGEGVKTYKDQTEMVEGISDTISIRATGVAWCTADTAGCNGGSGADRTKCGDCSGSVIDNNLQKQWEAIYTQQIELLSLDDIGEQGKVSARLALQRCEKVLADLGADIGKLKKAECV